MASESIPSPGAKNGPTIRKDFDTLSQGIYYGFGFKMAAYEDEEMADLLHRLAMKVESHQGQVIRKVGE